MKYIFTHIEISSDSYLSRACIRRCMRSLRANFRSFASDDKMDGSSGCSEMFECLSYNDMTLQLLYAIKYTTKAETLNLTHICII